MFENLFSFPKRYWIMAHFFEVVLGFLVFLFMYPHGGMEVLPLWQVFVSYISTFLFFVAFSIAVFPVSLSMIHGIDSLFVQVSDYISPLLVWVPFFVYYILWLVPDKKWNERQLFWISRVRVVWFLISSVAAWIVLFQLV